MTTELERELAVAALADDLCPCCGLPKPVCNGIENWTLGMRDLHDTLLPGLETFEAPGLLACSGLAPPWEIESWYVPCPQPGRAE